MKSTSENPDQLFEVGKLFCDRGDFVVAIERLRLAADLYSQQKSFKGYFKSINLLLRMYAEREEHKAIDKTKEEIQDLILNQEVQPSAKTYYTLALCANYKHQHNTALDYLEKSLKLALAQEDKENMCYAINGYAIVYAALGRLEEALKEVYNLKVFFQVMPLPELEMSSQILNGHILRMMGKHEQALEIFWNSYDQLKEQKNFYMYITLLYAMGVTYADAGDKELARLYLNLAKKSADPDNLKFVSRVVRQRLEALGGENRDQYDLIFDSEAKAIVEKGKGRVDFKNQFILLDMLRLFLQNPGEVYSKEALVRRVWKQDYNPAVHDNKIYVTIKRLRKLIEPDYDQPKYIFRAKNGYYLNRDTKVLVN